MNLVRAEVARLFGRRFTLVLILVLLFAFAVTLATTMASTHRPSATAVAAAERQAERERVMLERELATCQAEAARGSRFTDCARIRPDEVRVEHFLPNVFVFANSIRDLVLFLTGYLALFGFLAGASYVGAELTSGGMTNLLLWRPQRLLVLATKLAVLLGGVLVVAVTAAALYLSAFWTMASLAGLPGDVGGTFWADLAALLLRGLGLALIVSALGFGVATLGRHTSAAVGLLAGYAVAWELGARIVLEIIRAPRLEQWFLSTYIGAWMTGRIGLHDRSCYLPVCDPWYDLTWGHASIVFAALLALAVGGAFAAFHRRDMA